MEGTKILLEIVGYIGTVLTLMSMMMTSIVKLRTWSAIGSSIKERLESIYAKYGRYLNKVDSFEFPGLSGMDKMAGIMASLRENAPAEIGGYKVVKVTDYKDTAATGLPAANVLVYGLEGGATVIVRPSGTEPKIKTYFTTLGKDLAEAQAQKDVLAAALKPILA